MTSYNEGDEICGYCLSNRTGLPFTDLRETAKWRRTFPLTKEQFVARFGEPRHPLLDSGLVTQQFFRIDIMHSFDCNGLTAIVAGSVLWHLVACPTDKAMRELGPTQDARLASINNKMAMYQSEHMTPSPMPRLALQNLTLSQQSASFACLHGVVIKAANTRHLMPFVSCLAHEYLTANDPMEISALKVVDSLCKFYELIYTADMFLTTAEKRLCRDLLLRLGKHFQNAAYISRRNGGVLFYTTFKVHVCQHVAEQAFMLNPRYLQNYQDEGLVGRVAGIFKGCKSGPFRKVIQRSALTKYIVGLCLKYHGLA